MSWVRGVAGRVKRRIAPSADLATYRRLVKHAARVPRRTPGTLRLPTYELAYTDALTLCPQWNDIFLRKTMDFACARDAPRILDCGANVGLASLWFKRRWPAARVTAYEADPAIATCLRKNLSANGASDVEVVEAAAWTETGTVPFDREGADAGAIRNDAEARVPSIRLRDALDEQVDLLKLDVEGAEFTLLADCAPALGNVHALFVEVHEFEPSRRRTQEALDVLATQGFTYALDDLVPMPWRGTAGEATPFPRAATQWALIVRAWREK